MDDLIVLLIRALAKWLGGGQTRRPGQPNPTPPNQPPARGQQIRKMVTTAKRPAKGQPRGRLPALPPIPMAEPVIAVPHGPIQSPAPAPHASTRQAPGTARADLRHWLTPAVLRRQFILTEVLQPPLALREQKH
jgi:hypothetical protein